MQTSTRRTVVVVALSLSAVVGLSAKGPTARILIEGDTLRAPIEITDRAILNNFPIYDWPTPQRDGFVIQYSPTSLPEPPRGWSRYKVTFFLKRTDGTHPVYTVVYQFDPSAKQGFIYVPPTEMNVSTILRSGMEDWWFRASAAWERDVRPLIEQARTR